MHFILFWLKTDKKKKKRPLGWKEGEDVGGWFQGLQERMRQVLKGRFWEIPGDRDSITSQEGS